MLHHAARPDQRRADGADIGLGHAVLQLVHLVPGGLHLAEGRQGLFQHRAVGGGHQVLGVVAHADAALGGGPHHGAAVQLQFAQQHLEDGALAGAVAADDAPALVLLESPGNVLQPILGTEAEIGVVKACEHGRDHLGGKNTRPPDGGLVVWWS